MNLDGSSNHSIQSPDGKVVASFECRNISFEVDNSSTCFRISATNLLPGNLAEVYRTNASKYKRVADKVKPVSVDLQDGTKPFNWAGVSGKSVLDAKEVKERVDSLLQPSNGFLNKKESAELERMLTEFIDVFAFSNKEIGRLNTDLVPEHKIRTVPHIKQYLFH